MRHADRKAFGLGGTPPEHLAHLSDLANIGPTLAAAEIGVWQLDMLSGLATWDSVTSEILGLGQAPQLDPRPLPIHPDDRADVARRLERNARGIGERDVEVRIVRPCGEVRWVRSTARAPFGLAGEARWVSGIVADITEQKAAEAALIESRRQLSMLIDNLPGIAYRCAVKAPWRMSYVSEGVELLTGYKAAEIMALESGWGELIHPDDAQRVDAQVTAAVAERRMFSMSYRILHRDGSVRWVLERGQAAYGEDGQPVFLDGFIGDISEQKQVEEKVRWIANHDSLTGLPNRLLFQERLDALVDGSSSTTRFALLILDVDEFKRVNDTLGHDAGDSLLCAFAERLREAIRDDDLVARLGGDEFAIILQGVTTIAEIETAVEGIFRNLASPHVYASKLLDCSASIGGSLFPLHGGSRAEILKNADIAVYAAKAAGRGNFKMFQPEMRAEVQCRISMLALARDALDEDRVAPFYQPKIDLRTGAIAGFEALLRWKDPRRGFQTPDLIAAAFEDATLAAEISDRMIERVIADISVWQRRGLDFGHVAVNAAAAEFRRGDFAERLLDRMAAASLQPGLVQLEVTETVFLGRGADYVGRALRVLSSAGIKIALDDFGTGYASLSHLKQFPVDILKVDRSFVRDLESGADAAAIIRAVVNLGKSLEIETVAEGIETAAQHARLVAKGADYGQGFFYSPAVPAAEVPALLESNARH